RWSRARNRRRRYARPTRRRGLRPATPAPAAARGGGPRPCKKQRRPPSGAPSTLTHVLKGRAWRLPQRFVMLSISRDPPFLTTAVAGLSRKVGPASRRPRE